MYLRSRSSAEDGRVSEASTRQGGWPCRSELKAIGLAGLVIGPFFTFLGVEGG